MEQETVRRGPELEEVSRGSVILGVIGAFLGAVVGAVPWFLASTFTNFFIGYLGFLIGWAAAFGYSKLHGRKSFPLAMVTVVVCSIAALVLADFASNMYALCTDADWQDAAGRYGIPVARLAYWAVTDPENLGVILPNLGVGLLIGLLGVASCGRYVRQYTDPGMAQKVQPQTAGFAAAQGRWGVPASTGLELPRQFAVRAPKWTLVLGIVLTVLSAFLLAVIVLVGIMEELGEGGMLLAILWIWLLAMSIVVILQGRNWRLEVDGDRLCAYTAFNRPTEFHASDIANVAAPSALSGQAKLYGRDGKVLFKFTQAMQNQALLMQYLAEHNVPLRG